MGTNDTTKWKMTWITWNEIQSALWHANNNGHKIKIWMVLCLKMNVKNMNYEFWNEWLVKWDEMYNDTSSSEIDE